MNFLSFKCLTSSQLVKYFSKSFYVSILNVRPIVYNFKVLSFFENGVEMVEKKYEIYPEQLR